MSSATPNKNSEKIKSVLKPSPRLLRFGAITGLLIVIIGAALIFGGNSKPSESVKADCGTYRTDRVIRIQGRAFNAEVAANAAEFQKGLGGRPCIKSNQALVFAFTKPGQYPFWMKDMKFPLDFVWVGQDDKVAATLVDVKPSTYPKQFANSANHPAKYVIELPADSVKQLNIVLGTIVNF